MIRMSSRMTSKQITMAAVVGAMYAALTVAGAGFSYGPIQFRISEALCVLPFFFPGTIWGLFVGCFLANVIGPYGIIDIVFGSLATLIAALITSKVRIKWLAPLPPVIINGLIIGAELAYLISPGTFWVSFAAFGTSVAFGELVVCYTLGSLILVWLPKIKFFNVFIADAKKLKS